MKPKPRKEDQQRTVKDKMVIKFTTKSKEVLSEAIRKDPNTNVTALVNNAIYPGLRFGRAAEIYLAEMVEKTKFTREDLIEFALNEAADKLRNEQTAADIVNTVAKQQ